MPPPQGFPTQRFGIRTDRRTGRYLLSLVEGVVDEVLELLLDSLPAGLPSAAGLSSLCPFARDAPEGER